MEKKSGSGIRNERPRSFFRELRNSFMLKILKFFLTLDPGWKISDPGSGIRINIPDPQQWLGISWCQEEDDESAGMDTLDLLEREAERKRKRRYDSPEESRTRGRDSPESKRKKRGEDGTRKRKRTEDDSAGNQMR
jgi:hypothetical protein